MGIERRTTDLQVNGSWGKYREHTTADRQGYMRITRQRGMFKTYYWAYGH